MKLSAKNSIFFLIVTLLVFSLGAWLFYLQIQDIISEEATEELEVLKEDVLAHIEKTKQIPESINALTLLNSEPVNAVGKERVRDTSRYVKAMGETLPFSGTLNTRIGQPNAKIGEFSHAGTSGIETNHENAENTTR